MRVVPVSNASTALAAGPLPPAAAGPARPRAKSSAGQPTPAAPPSQASGAAYRHVSQALTLYEARAPIYSRLTGGASESLSRSLVWTERLAKPVMLLIDGWAADFNRRGIAIISGDFVSMNDVRPVNTPPRYPGQATPAQLEELRTALGDYRQQARRAIKAADFRGVAALTYDMLRKLADLEARAGASFSMTRHVLEAAGTHALNAIDYAAQSRAQTIHLSQVFLRLHLMVLGRATRLDTKAQPLHAMGVGILDNDLPHIPFVERWQAIAR